MNRSLSNSSIVLLFILLSLGLQAQNVSVNRRDTATEGTAALLTSSEFPVAYKVCASDLLYGNLAFEAEMGLGNDYSFVAGAGLTFAPLNTLSSFKLPYYFPENATGERLGYSLKAELKGHILGDAIEQSSWYGSGGVIFRNYDLISQHTQLDNYNGNYNMLGLRGALGTIINLNDWLLIDAYAFTEIRRITHEYASAVEDGGVWIWNERTSKTNAIAYGFGLSIGLIRHY
ncbi:MAG: hypothetical protein HWE14_10425 [Flavobacteriia bacterium]|nr:hypothetical protein [Flavobacteriia bacterium]